MLWPGMDTVINTGLLDHLDAQGIGQNSSAEVSDYMSERCISVRDIIAPYVRLTVRCLKD